MTDIGRELLRLLTNCAHVWQLAEHGWLSLDYCKVSLKQVGGTVLLFVDGVSRSSVLTQADAVALAPAITTLTERLAADTRAADIAAVRAALGLPPENAK
jgi:hypothetical protein